MRSENSAADDVTFLRRAIQLAREHMEAGHGGPFGAVIVRDAEVLATGWNQVTTANDPTAHAEVVAIRAAAAALRNFQLKGCVLYSSCEPCPMCLAAAYWARLDRIVFAASRTDAAAAGFDDELLYSEIGMPASARRLPAELLREEALAVFDRWRALPNKVPY
jgi:tRNA(Arg) A34 adenosine deaminase TadA